MLDSIRCPNANTNSESVTIYLMEPQTCEYVLGVSNKLALLVERCKNKLHFQVESSIICELLSTVDENGLFVVPPSSDEVTSFSSSSAELFDDEES